MNYTCVSKISFIIFLCFLFLSLPISISSKIPTPYNEDKNPYYVMSNESHSGASINAHIDLISGSGPYGNDIPKLHLKGTYINKNTFRLRITDREKHRYEVPWVVTVDEPEQKPSTDYSVSFQKDPFSFSVTRKQDGLTLFNSSSVPFVYSNQYISIGSNSLGNNPNIYGFGERVHPFRLDPHDRTYTMFNKDNGNTPDINLYGTHPFYIQYSKGSFYGVFMYNSNAMDAIINNSHLQYKMIGGIIDLFIFSGPTADDVLQQYHFIIGKPYLPPYWSLGWNQCRWGYRNLNETRQVVHEYNSHSLPLEVMWNDIDYMDEYKDFTLSPNRFPPKQMREFVDELHESGRRYVMILDPGIKNEEGYAPYDEGIEQNVFITLNGVPVVNKVWPGYTVFPDFTSKKGINYWHEQVSKFHKELPFDGLWIDMNEIVGFCNSECNGTNLEPEKQVTSKDHQHEYGDFKPDFPPFVPGAVPLDTRTISMSSMLEYSVNYNVHNLYGITETNATRLALESIRQKRALVISRSTFAGQGHIGAHWLGDNESTWKSMYYSIPGILSMNMFGIPFVGADICGFNGNTTQELCTRWIQLGVFYPFSRNHNSIHSISQEPYAFGAQTTSVARNAIRTRYSLLPYYYSLLFHTHRFGGAVARPMVFEFPQDTESSLPFMDRQFLIGPALLIAPVLKQGATSKSVYLPKESLWYDLYSGKEVYPSGWKTVDAPLYGQAPAFVRGGFILPMHSDPDLTLQKTRAKPMSILAALDRTGTARGELYVDEGDELDVVENGDYSHIHIKIDQLNTRGVLSVKLAHAGFYGHPSDINMTVDMIRVLGIKSPVCRVLVDNNAIEDWTFSTDDSILEITNQKLHLIKFGVITFIYC